MKSDTTLMNELAHKSSFLHELSPQESDLMKKTLVSMYTDLQNLCDQYGLRLMLGGGSCLGAVRHQGFIPWDDDLDVMIPRQDYEQLIKLLQAGALGDKYEYSTPNPNTESAIVFLKIYLKDSLDIDLFNINTPFPKGLYIDVFAIDAAPNNIVLRTIKGLIADCLQFCSIITLYAKYPNPHIQKFMAEDPTLRKRYLIKSLLGRIIGLVPRRKWQWWFDQWVSNDRESGIWTVPTGRKYYCGEAIDRQYFVPITSCTFEGMNGKIPTGYHAYLSNLYGDYMQIPPVEKRERHFIHQLQIPSPKA